MTTPSKAQTMQRLQSAATRYERAAQADPTSRDTRLLAQMFTEAVAKADGMDTYQLQKYATTCFAAAAQLEDDSPGEEDPW